MEYFRYLIKLIKLAYELVQEVQKELGEGTGELKRAIVVEALEAAIESFGVDEPTAIKLSRAMVDGEYPWLEKIVDFVKGRFEDK